MSFFLTAYSFGEVWVLLIAMIGGIAVFLGLSLEKIAELKNERLVPQFFKPHKKLETLGWIVLMAGILQHTYCTFIVLKTWIIQSLCSMKMEKLWAGFLKIFIF